MYYSFAQPPHPYIAPSLWHLVQQCIFQQELHEKDDTFIKELRRKTPRISDSEVDELLKRHLADVEAIRRRRTAKSERLNEKLQAKLIKKRARHGDDYIVSYHAAVVCRVQICRHGDDYILS